MKRTPPPLLSRLLHHGVSWLARVLFGVPSEHSTQDSGITPSDEVATFESLDYDARPVFGQPQLRTNAGRDRNDGPLTARQRQYARLICDGLTDREIAERMDISFNGARAHRSQIYKRLGVHSADELCTMRSEWDSLDD